MKKVFSIIGMAIGAIFVIVGILSMLKAFDGTARIADSAPGLYDSGYASFGGDYYTYSSNNAAEAASAARTTANNIKHIADFLTSFLGLTSVLFGLMVICGFGIVLSSCPKKTAPQPAAEPSASVYDAEPTETAAPFEQN